MTLQGSHSAKPGELHAVPLERLAHWSSLRPEQIALLHKRRGQWKAWRWSDVEHDVARLREALGQQGFGADSHLVLSGTFEPTLILLALAAASIGGAVHSLPRAVTSVELRALLGAKHHVHVYLEHRQGVAQALEAGEGHPREVILLSPKSAAHHRGNCRVLPVADLHGEPRAQASRVRWRAATEPAPVWVEGCTDWAEGLAQVLGHWFESGVGLAFPESIESAARDRRDISPAALLLSPAGLHGLAGEIESRLAPAGSRRRRLVESILRQPGGGLRRRLRGRVRGQLGLQRLERVVRSALPSSAPAPAWVDLFLEEAS